TRGALSRRRSRRAARRLQLPAAGRERANRAHPLGLRRPRLRHDRTRARLAARPRPRAVRRGQRRRSARRRAPPLAHRGHSAGARKRARRRRGHQTRAGWQGQDLHRESLRPRRQGYRYLPREFQGVGFAMKSPAMTSPAMTRIGRLFLSLKRENRKGLIAFLTAGDPSPLRTPALVAAMVRGGADLIELGVPFSDPVADGPVIQRYGVERQARDAAAAGIDGCLLTDASVEEAETYVRAMHRNGLDTVFLAAPTSTPRRIKLVAQYSTGFVYLVSRTGVTGVQDSLPASVTPLVQAVRAVTDLPLAVGFGISQPAHVAELGRQVEAVVVGSAFVRLIGQHADNPALETLLEAFTRELKSGFGAAA